MNDLNLCLEVVSMSCQPLRYIWRWISRKPLETEAWIQRTTNRKWHMDNQMVTWPMTSRDLERSNSWPQYHWSSISRKWLDLQTPLQRTTNRKWHMGYEMVTWPMTSRNPEGAVRHYGWLSQWQLGFLSYLLINRLGFTARRFTGPSFWLRNISGQDLKTNLLTAHYGSLVHRWCLYVISITLYK